MKRALSLAVLLASLVAWADAAETVYAPPNPRPANPAAAPSSKADDWLSQIQAKFDRYGSKHADIVFDGDSITNRWESTGRETWTRFAGRAADFGIEGDRTEHVLWRLSKGQLDGVDPKVVVLMIGTNNISKGDTPARIAEGVRAILDEYERRCPNAHVILMAVFPRGKTPDDPMRLKVKALNEIIKDFATTDKRLTYVDIGPKLIEPNGEILPSMEPDFLHPGGKGYVFWAEAIEPLIARYAPPGKP